MDQKSAMENIKLHSYLTSENFEQMQRNASSAESDKKKKGKDLYTHYTRYFSKQRDITKNNFLDATSIAYSWMPTMLDLYFERGERSLQSCVIIINELRQIRTYRQFDNFNKAELKEKLSILKSVINNSIVGVSKTLHFFNPSAPIFDSRVHLSWNWFFENTGLEIANSVNGYIKYWELVLYWKIQLKEKNIKASSRKIEKLFFDFGGHKKFKKKKTSARIITRIN